MKIVKTTHSVVIKHDTQTFKIYPEIFYSLKINEQEPLEKHILSRLTIESLKFEAKEKALKALRSPKTTYEIKQLLKAYDANIVNDIISALKQYKWIDDIAYMTWYVEIHGTYGKKYVSNVFKEKGIAFESVDSFLNTIDDQLKIEDVFFNLNKSIKGVTTEVKKRKIYQKLFALGFETTLITPLLSNISVPKEDELKLLDAHFNKRQSKLKGTPYEKCQLWIRYAVSKGFDYRDAKAKCEDIV